MDGLVCRCKDGVVPPRGEQLGEGGLAHAAGSHPAQHIQILAVLRMLLKITRDGLIPKYVSGRSVDVLSAAEEDGNHHHGCDASSHNATRCAPYVEGGVTLRPPKERPWIVGYIFMPLSYLHRKIGSFRGVATCKSSKNNTFGIERVR